MQNCDGRWLIPLVEPIVLDPVIEDPVMVEEPVMDVDAVFAEAPPALVEDPPVLEPDVAGHAAAARKLVLTAQSGKSPMPSAAQSVEKESAAAPIARTFFIVNKIDRDEGCVIN
ncbi:MAG: hypothetical protein Q9220_006127 [cf. Caloplaca sp. 1 TL-2023]